MATQTINTVPSANSTFIADLQAFLRDESAGRDYLTLGNGIISGGIGVTSASLAHTISALVAFPNGYYVSQAATAHTYTASKRTFVFVRDSDSRSITIAAAVITYSTHLVFAEMASSTTQPATPTGCAPLFYADTDGTSITAVTDIRVWLRTKVLPEWYGAVGDGVTDDSAAFTAAQAVSDQIYVGNKTYLASFTLLTGKSWYFENSTILGSIDCTNALNASMLGHFTIVPQAGATYGMLWRKTRYCYFQSLRIGNTQVIDTHPGKGLSIQGGLNAGSYYNTIDRLFIQGMDDYGLHLKTDVTEAVYRIGANGFNSVAIQYCSGGIYLEGASVNVFSNISVEQCTDTILALKTGAGGATSTGNKLYGLYTENPAAGTYIDFDAGSVGTELFLTNEYAAMPAALKSGALGSLYHGVGSFRALTEVQSWGNFKLFQTTDTYPRFQTTKDVDLIGAAGAWLGFGDGTVEPPLRFGKTTAEAVGTDNATWLRAGSGAYNQSGLRMGADRFWVDATGRLRRLSGSDPAADTNGQPVASYPLYSAANVANPPTNAEMISTFGAAATTGAGFVAVLNDAGGGSNEYLIWSDGAKYWYLTGTACP